MAITTYSELQTAVENWLNRSDLSSRVPEFITLAEAKFKRDPRVRDFSASGAAITPLSGGSPTNWLLTAHPDIYLYGSLVASAPFLHEDERLAVWKTLLEEALNEVQTSRLDMTRTLGVSSYADLQELVAEYLNRPDLAPNVPVWITLAEAALKRDLAGAPTITALSGGTNWLYTSHPDVYLYATLCEAGPWLGEDPRLVSWKALRDERVREVLRSRSATAYDLTSYSGLQTAIKGFLDRQDIDAAALVTLAEKSLGRDERLRRLKSATLVVDAEEENVPTDFQNLITIAHDGGTYFGPLEIVDASTLPSIKAQAGGVSGVPSHVAVLDGKFRFAPVPNASFTLDITYNQSIGSASAGTSWLFTASPDIYLYASLVAAAPYLNEDARLPVWSSLLEKEIEAVRVETWNKHFSGAPMRRRFKAIG